MRRAVLCLVVFTIAIVQGLSLSAAVHRAMQHSVKRTLISRLSEDDKAYWNGLFPPCAILQRQSSDLPKALAIKTDNWRYLTFVKMHPVPWKRVTDPVQLAAIEAYLIGSAQTRVKSEDDNRRVFQYSRSLPFEVSENRMAFYLAKTKVDSTPESYLVLRTDFMINKNSKPSAYARYYSVFDKRLSLRTALMEAVAPDQGTFYWSKGIYFTENGSVSLLALSPSSGRPDPQSIGFQEYCRY